MARIVRFSMFLFLVCTAFEIWALEKSPSWVESPQDNCRAGELCAVGVGSGPLGAQNAARAELLKIFSAEVESKLKSTTSSTSQELGGGEVRQDVLMSAGEKTQGILQGAQIRSTYHDDHGYFAFAVLNKAQAAQAIKVEIEKIDQEINNYYKDASRWAILQAIGLSLERELIHWRYQFLSGSSLEAPVSLEKLYQKKQQLSAKEVVVLLRVETQEKTTKARELFDQVGASLLAQNYKVISDQRSRFQAKVLVVLNWEKMHFNVKGFERYKFVLTSSAYDDGEKLKGQIVFDTTQTGRSFSQSLENALPEMKKFITQKINELHID